MSTFDSWEIQILEGTSLPQRHWTWLNKLAVLVCLIAMDMLWTALLIDVGAPSPLSVAASLGRSCGLAEHDLASEQ